MIENNTFPDRSQVEAETGFSFEALEQFETIMRYLDECADSKLLDEIKVNEDGFNQLVNYATQLRVFSGVNYDA
tara:strand:+ start:28851 stop:29072 length:222 start_codon:yes stop_codon:yes gene_type:complete